jgi:hypothetical protein
MIRGLMGWLGRLFGTALLHQPRCGYLVQWPNARHGKTGIAAARRKARKLRNRRRARHA